MSDKYSPQRVGGFLDPVVRCQTCSEIVKTKSLLKIGGCPKCGNKRVGALRVFNQEEWDKMKEWGIDPEFYEQFVEVDEDD